MYVFAQVSVFAVSPITQHLITTCHQPIFPRLSYLRLNGLTNCALADCTCFELLPWVLLKHSYDLFLFRFVLFSSVLFSSHFLQLLFFSWCHVCSLLYISTTPRDEAGQLLIRGFLFMLEASRRTPKKQLILYILLLGKWTSNITTLFPKSLNNYFS